MPMLLGFGRQNQIQFLVCGLSARASQMKRPSPEVSCRSASEGTASQLWAGWRNLGAVPVPRCCFHSILARPPVCVYMKGRSVLVKCRLDTSVLHNLPLQLSSLFYFTGIWPASSHLQPRRLQTSLSPTANFYLISQSPHQNLTHASSAVFICPAVPSAPKC